MSKHSKFGESSVWICLKLISSPVRLKMQRTSQIPQWKFKAETGLRVSARSQNRWFRLWSDFKLYTMDLFPTWWEENHDNSHQFSAPKPNFTRDFWFWEVRSCRCALNPRREVSQARSPKTRLSESQGSKNQRNIMTSHETYSIDIYQKSIEIFGNL